MDGLMKCCDAGYRYFGRVRESQPCNGQRRNKKIMRTNLVIIVDADDVRRNGIEALIQKSQMPFEVAAAFATMDDSISWLQVHPAHFLLMDDTLLGGLDPVRMVQQLRNHHPSLSIIILSDKLNVAYIHDLFFHGISGFVDKFDRFADRILQALMAAERGELYLSQKASRLVYPGRPQVDLKQLTHRDLGITRLMRDGLTVQEIAAILGISDQAVYRSRRKLREILQVQTSEQIVSVAIEKGLI